MLLTLHKTGSHEQAVPGVSIYAESMARAAEWHAQRFRFRTGVLQLHP